MPDSPVSTLTALAKADLVTATDLLYVVDVSAGAAGSKKITVADIMQSGPGLTHCIVGYMAGASITSATFVHAVGYYALNKLTSGTGNAAFGRQAGEDVTTGTQNTLIGNLAGMNITTGSSNTMVGGDTGVALTTGSSNTAVGLGALATSANAQTECTAVGRGALYSDTADANTALGAYALYSKATGANNVAVGMNAGRYADAGGSVAVTAAASSTYVGRNVRAGSATGDSNSIVIGFGSLGLGANTTVIGNSSTTLASMFGAHMFTTVAAPSGVADACHIYSADQAAGNACPHVRTENGATVKLFQGAAVADATDAATTMARLNDLLARLRAHGLIAT